MNRLTLEEKAFGDYTPGRFAWILEGPVAFKAIIGARGSLTLWEFKGEINLKYCDVSRGNKSKIMSKQGLMPHT